MSAIIAAVHVVKRFLPSSVKAATIPAPDRGIIAKATSTKAAMQNGMGTAWSSLASERKSSVGGHRLAADLLGGLNGEIIDDKPSIERAVSVAYATNFSTRSPQTARCTC
jgi:hypothetical protein